MAIDEQARHELYNQLVTTLGPGHARTLMEHLPPVGWADVATKRDVDAALLALRHELTGTVHEAVAELRAEINAQTRLLFFSMLTTMLAATSLAFAAARLGIA
jgi:hypothetical protein